MNNTVRAAPLGSHPTAQANSNLGTTPVIIVLDPDGAGVNQRARTRQVTVTNPNATNWIAWMTVDKGDTAPTFVATFAATAGVPVPPGMSQSFTIPTAWDLYVVADAAAQSYSVASAIEG